MLLCFLVLTFSDNFVRIILSYFCMHFFLPFVLHLTTKEYIFNDFVLFFFVAFMPV